MLLVRIQSLGLTMLNKIDKEEFASGFFDGLKRFNPKKLLQDPKDEIGSYKLGYTSGMLLKIGLAFAGYEFAF
jgi:hypothetical protein